jgi:hypothetical protein
MIAKEFMEEGPVHGVKCLGDVNLEQNKSLTASVEELGTGLHDAMPLINALWFDCTRTFMNEASRVASTLDMSILKMWVKLIGR